MPRPSPALALAALLLGTGTLHFLVAEPFDAIVPHRLPGPPRYWTWLSGAAELAVAGLVAAPRTRRVGGALAAALFVAVFPGNVQMALDWAHRPWPLRLIAYGRLPLQVPLVVWALVVRHHAAPARASLRPPP